MSLISSVKTYIATYSGLKSAAGLLVETLGSVPTQYAIVPLPGARIIETYIDGGSRRQFSFALQSTESTADDPARIANNEFYEDFADWMESQTEAGTLPTLATGKTAESIEATGLPILFQLGESGSGVYQLQCVLIYEQDP